MAEPLKTRFGLAVVRWIARSIAASGHPLDQTRFVAEIAEGFEPLSLMARGQRIARVMRGHLPASYPRATDVLLATTRGEPPPSDDDDHGMSAFAWLPHTLFVGEYGLDHFDASMRALHRLTQCFTGEFGIRPFLEHRPEQTLARLREWAADPNPKVRRLVSEGTRPRLPWASRLRAFVADPRPVLALLELLKDDPSPDVRRSVANSLNDIGKDHPELAVDTLRRWQRDASEARQWIVRHALRSAVKRAEPGALALLGCGDAPRVRVVGARIAPARVPIGGTTTIAFGLANVGATAQRLLVDCRIHFTKAGGRTGPKVFKLKRIDIAPGETLRFVKRLALVDLTTRRHYPGKHRVEALVNGTAFSVGGFDVLARG